MTRRQARAVVDLIDGVETRCLAADGPVTPTADELTDDETGRLRMLGWKGATRRPSEDELRRLYRYAEARVK